MMFFDPGDQTELLCGAGPRPDRNNLEGVGFAFDSCRAPKITLSHSVPTWL